MSMASTLTSPKSFTKTAIFRVEASAKTQFNTVVFPAPKNPLKMVRGIGFEGS